MKLPEVPLVASSALLTAMYFFSGLEKLGKLEKVAVGLRERTFEAPVRFFVGALVISSFMLVLTSSTIVYSSVSGKLRTWARASALYLVAFTVLATILYHWPPTGKTYYPFISNVTACGGLLLLSNQFRD